MPKTLAGEAMFKSRVVRFRQLRAAVMQPAACSHALVCMCHEWESQFNTQTQKHKQVLHLLKAPHAQTFHHINY